MQRIGHIKLDNKKIKVLYRLSIATNPMNPNHGKASLKIRRTGEDDQLFESESEYLSERPDLVDLLLKGKVVFC